MLLDLKEYFVRDNTEQTTTVECDFKQISSAIGSFDITDKTPLSLTIFHEKNKNLKVSGQMELTVDIPCDRCLKPVKRYIAIAFDREFQCGEAKGAESDEQNVYIVDKVFLDIDKIVFDEILIQWPMKIVCSQDCRGICLKCGQDLNVSDCGCDRVVLDPRMAVIQDIFKNADK